MAGPVIVGVGASAALTGLPRRRSLVVRPASRPLAVVRWTGVRR